MTKESSTSEEVIAACLGSVGGDILKTDVLGRITVGSAQREAILDAFEASGMTGQAFALHHGIKIQTFASWMQKRRRRRGDYQNESLCRKLRMRKDPPQVGLKKVARPQAPMNLIELHDKVTDELFTAVSTLETTTWTPSCREVEYSAKQIPGFLFVRGSATS